MALYDLKSVMDLVYSKTKRKSLYIGYSMGTTVSYIYSIKLQDHAEKTLLGIISLAPVAYLDNIKSYLKYFVPIVPILKVSIDKNMF